MLSSLHIRRNIVIGIILLISILTSITVGIVIQQEQYKRSKAAEAPLTPIQSVVPGVGYLNTPWTQAELATFMKKLADQTILLHGRKSTAHPEFKGQIYEYARINPTTPYQGTTLDTMHDGAWFGNALTSAYRATKDNYYVDTLNNYTLEFYPRMLNTSDQYFPLGLPEDQAFVASYDAIPKPADYPQSPVTKGLIPYWFDDGESKALDLAVLYKNKPLIGYRTGKYSSLHMQQDITLLLASSFQLTKRQDIAEALKNFLLASPQAYPAEAGGHPSAYLKFMARKLLPSDQEVLAKVPNLPTTNPPIYTNPAAPPFNRGYYYNTLYSEGTGRLPGFQDGETWGYYQAIIDQDRYPLTDAIAKQYTYLPYATVSLNQLWYGDTPRQPGVDKFDLDGSPQMSGGKFSPYYNQNKNTLQGARQGPMNLFFAAVGLQLLKEFPNAWDRYRTSCCTNDTEVEMRWDKVTLDGATTNEWYSQPVDLETDVTARFASTIATLSAYIDRPKGKAVSFSLYARPDAGALGGTFTINTDLTISAKGKNGTDDLVVEKATKEVAGREQIELAIPYTVVETQKPWATAAEDSRLSIKGANNTTKNLYFYSSKETVKAILEKEIVEGLRFWEFVLEDWGMIPTGWYGTKGKAGIWSGFSDLGGYAHLINAAAAYKEYLDGKNDWDLYKTATIAPQPSPTPTPVSTNKPMPQWDASMYSQDVENWWANHPFNPQSSTYIPIGDITSPTNVINVKSQFAGDIAAAFNALPTTGGTLFLDPGTYTLDTLTYLIGKSNVHIVSNGGATIKGGGYFYIASCDAAKNYTHFNALVIVGNRNDAPVQDAIRCATTDRIKNIYFKNIVFDGAGIGTIVVAALTTNGMVFDNVTFQNYIADPNQTSGNIISTVAMSDNIWVRGSSFIGNSYNAAYFDGCHGCGFVENTFNSNFSRGIFDGKTNSDFTNDWDGNGTADPNSMDIREMNHFVFAHNTFGQTGSGIIPLNELVYASTTNALIKNNTISSRVKGLATFNGKCIAPNAPQLATYGSLNFTYTNLKVIGNTTQNVTNLVRIDASTPNCNGTTNIMTIGKYVIANNTIQNAPNFKSIVTETGGTVVGPNLLCGNSANGNLTDAACDGTTPTPTSISSTITPTRTPTPLQNSPTPQPTSTPFPTPTLPSGRTLFVRLLLHGVGFGGDSQTPGASGNFSPLTPQRIVTLQYYTSPQGTPLATSSGVVTFDSVAGNFTGSSAIPSSLPDGSYLVKLQTPRYLRALAQGFITLDPSNVSSQLPLATTTLIAGDSNGDNFLSILDYNILADCFSIDAPPRSCSDPQKKLSADLNDDGHVDGVDINLLIRNAQVRSGS